MIINRFCSPAHLLLFAQAELRSLRRNLRTRRALKHVIFLIADHFEPVGYDNAGLKAYFDDYEALAARHRDSRGERPRITWFYPGEERRVIDAVNDMAQKGLGEIELHIHHGKGTELADVACGEKLKELINSRLDMLRDSKEPQERRYAFVHGMWALDNSRRGMYCGVNNELEVLRDTGCFADFTFPAWGPMQPAKVSSIYYAADNPGRPKSYNTGKDAEVGRKQSGDLLIFEGPAAGSLEILLENPTAAVKTVDSWVKEHICVIGREEWIFVKTDIHSMATRYKERVFEESIFDRIFSYLEEKYNGTKEYALHYATAREAYNIVKAAEDGMAGNPGDYRDYSVKPYADKND